MVYYNLTEMLCPKVLHNLYLQYKHAYLSHFVIKLRRTPPVQNINSVKNIHEKDVKLIVSQMKYLSMRKSGRLPSSSRYSRPY